MEKNDYKIKGFIKSFFPIANWLPKYKKSFIRWDLVAGITLASFVLPESVAYATLAGVPQQIRIIDALSNVREILRKQGLEEITRKISRTGTIAKTISEFKK